ncbi:MAG: porin, partial [Rikenellaceae bacterium]
MKKFLPLFFLMLFILPITAISQNVNGKNNSAVEVFYYSPSQPMSIQIIDFIRTVPEKHFLEPSAPRFLLMDSKHKFALGIGGTVRGTAGVDFVGIVPTSTNDGFQTAFIPTSLGNHPRSQALMSAATSEFFIKMVGNTGKLGMFSVYLSMNFMGNNYTPQLRNAYIDFLGFSIGQRWSTFTDLNAISPTIDYGGPISYAGYHLPQIRYTRMFAKQKFQFAVAAEFPTVNATYNTTTISQPQGVPNIVGYLQANTPSGGHVRVSGLYRSMNYDDLRSMQTERNNGWGVQLSGVTTISHAFKAYYQGIYGEGISSYMNDLSNFAYDMVPNAARRGDLQTLPMWGAYGGLQWNITPEIFSSFTYSYSRIYSSNTYPMSGMYKYAQ